MSKDLLYTFIMNEYKDDVVLVTGATGLIGSSIASKFADKGATVLLNDEGTERGQRMADSTDNFKYYPANLTDENSIKSLFNKIENKFHQLDILVNNVGHGTKGGSIRTTSTDTWDFEMDITLKSYWLCSKYAVEIMDNGKIVNNSSVHSEIAVKDRFPYNISKSAVNMLTRIMAVELSPEIRVNAVSPGKIDSEASTKQETKKYENTPMKRTGHPDEVADVVEFLTSEKSSYINGVTIPVDGGYLAHD